jgi:hypothetical protein
LYVSHIIYFMEYCIYIMILINKVCIRTGQDP